jgi:hypothetical protein
MTVFEHASRVPRKHPILFNGAVAILVVVLSLLIYKRTFDYSYLDWDDNTLVEQNVYVMQSGAKFPIGDLWTPGRTPGPFLPLRSFSYIVDREFFGANEKSHDAKGGWHHVVNTWLYILNGLLLLFALRKLLDPWTAAIATLIWVVHPLHVEGVAWVSGRKEMLAGVLMVGCFLFYVLAAEKRDKASPGVRWWSGSVLLTLAGTALLLQWVPIANRFALGPSSWIVGLGALGVILAGAAVAGGDERNHRIRVLVFSVLALLCGAAALLSKPVAIVMPVILLAWELGHRPLREKALVLTSRTGTFVILGALLVVAAGFGFAFVGRHTVGASVIRAAAVGALFGGCVFAATRIVAGLKEETRVWLDGWFERSVPTTEESLGMVVRALPFICLTLWGVGSTMDLASSGSVVKEAAWNAAPKSRSVSAFAAIWLDLYHLFVPLNLSSLYDVKSDVWHWQSVAGVVILATVPFACIWIYLRSPKSLVWLAWLVAPIVPVSGIVQIAAAHADRYLYLPAIAVAVGLGYLLSTAAFGSDEETGAWERWVASGLTIAILGGFTALSYQRVAVWRDDERLWGDAVRKNPDLPSALNNYGAALMNASQVLRDAAKKAKIEHALAQYYKAYEVLPTLDVAQFNIAATELRLGRPDKAQKYAEEFVAQHPEMPTGWILLGQLYLTQQRAAEAAGNLELRQAKLLAAQGVYEKGCDLQVDAVNQLQLQDKALSCGHLGTVFQALGNTTGMDMAFAKGFATAPNSKQLMVLRVRMLREGKRYKELQQLLEEQWAKGMTVDLARQIVQNLIAMDEKQRALEYMEQLLASGRAQQTDFLIKQRIEQAIKEGKPVDLKTPASAVPPVPDSTLEPRALRLPGLPGSEP